MNFISLRTWAAPVLAAAAVSLLGTSSSAMAQSSARGYSVGKAGELPKADRIVFLGDSITQSGQYIEFIETVLLADTDRRYEILNLGLASETASGLSEHGHADGKFPRPSVHERLTRVLDKTKPDLLVVCYGMNDGIYFPYKDERFEKFVRGIQTVRDRAWDRKIAVTHLTPPVFDPLPVMDKLLPPGRSTYPQPFVRYNTVLERYTLWMNGKARRTGWRVVDIHKAMADYLDEKRKTDAEFTLAKDGVHPNAEGHWVIAQPLLTSWGVKQDYTVEDFIGPAGRLYRLHQKVSARQKVLKAAWLSECGHKRPGVEPGLPLAEAQAKAAEITVEIDTLLAGGKAALAGGAAETPEEASPVPVAIPVTSMGEPKLAMTEAAPPAPDAPMAAAPGTVGSPEVAEEPPASTAALPSMSGATLARAETVPLTEPVPPPVPGGGAMLASATVSQPVEKETPALFPGVRGKWQGFDRYDFEVNGPLVTVVVPRQVAKGKPWVWHGEFFGHKPDPDVALLEKGFHIAYMKVNDMLGSPAAVKHWDAMYEVLTKKYGFNKKPALVGLSRGGLYCYNWAAANPGKVACIYADAPVCDFKSWPGGKGKGKGDSKNWQLVMQLWGFKDEAEALAYKGNPVDNLAPLAKNKVPLLHVFGDADDVVPWEENTGLVAERYRKLGGSIELIAKAGFGHHPHGLQDSTPIVNFILKHAGS